MKTNPNNKNKVNGIHQGKIQSQIALLLINILSFKGVIDVDKNIPCNIKCVK